MNLLFATGVKIDGRGVTCVGCLVSKLLFFYYYSFFKKSSGSKYNGWVENCRGQIVTKGNEDKIMINKSSR